MTSFPGCLIILLRYFWSAFQKSVPTNSLSRQLVFSWCSTLVVFPLWQCKLFLVLSRAVWPSPLLKRISNILQSIFSLAFKNCLQVRFLQTFISVPKSVIARACCLIFCLFQIMYLLVCNSYSFPKSIFSTYIVFINFWISRLEWQTIDPLIL